MDKGYLNFNINHSYEYNNNDSLDIVFNIVENNIVKVKSDIMNINTDKKYLFTSPLLILMSEK